MTTREDDTWSKTSIGTGHSSSGNGSIVAVGGIPSESIVDGASTGHLTLKTVAISTTHKPSVVSGGLRATTRTNTMGVYDPTPTSTLNSSARSSSGEPYDEMDKLISHENRSNGTTTQSICTSRVHPRVIPFHHKHTHTYCVRVRVYVPHSFSRTLFLTHPFSLYIRFCAHQ